MLTRPVHGWAEVCIGEHRLRVSHIEPVPEMLLTAFIRALSTDGTAHVAFDAEGWRWQPGSGGGEAWLLGLCSRLEALLD